MRLLFFLILLTLSNYAKYLTNSSCKECHEKIYQEYESSAHAKGYFTDELHKAIAQKINPNKYTCASCHMPQANNLQDLIQGKAKPDPNNPTHKDAISCFFCHTIAYVKRAHKFNIIQSAHQAKNYKPTLFGTLKNPEDSDKHSSLNSPIYEQVACIGCHSHKLNDNNVTVFKAMQKNQNSKSCIKCHMPTLAGGVEKFDKRARNKHKSHKFLGIRDKDFRKKGVDINLSLKKNKLEVTLHNKMAHPLIIQPARTKYLEIKLLRNNKTIWRNYQKNPKEDKQGYFAYFFKKGNRAITLPKEASSSYANNIEANETKKLYYLLPKLEKNDTIELNFWVQLAKDDCKKVIELNNTNYFKPMLIKKVKTHIKDIQ